MVRRGLVACEASLVLSMLAESAHAQIPYKICVTGAALFRQHCMSSRHLAATVRSTVTAQALHAQPRKKQQRKTRGQQRQP